MIEYAEIENGVKDVFVQTLEGVDAGMLNRQSNMSNVPNWNSLNFLKIILALESRFKLKFTPSEIARMYDFGNVIDLIAAKYRK